MEHIFNSLKELICPVMIRKASSVVGEKEANVSKASESIIASLLGVMLKNGDKLQVKNILDEASNLNILADAENICEERPTEEQRKIGDNFLQQLLGDKAADFSNPIATHAGISKVATNRLVSIIAPLVAGYLGNLLQDDNRNLPQLLRQIRDEKNSFASYIPSDLIQSFGLTSVLNETRTTAAAAAPVEKKKGNSWLIWLILIALLALLFFWWRSCSDGNNQMSRNEMAARDTIAATRVAPAATPARTATTNERDTLHLTLPNNQMVVVYKGGIEEELIKYLKSGAYKNATEDELKKKWFEFDNIDFEFNSASQLMDNSKTQLSNVTSILKSYPDAKIVVAGFADKKGTEAVNQEISKERALTIEKYFEKEGLGKQIVKIEGFGEKHATRSASASDNERAKDRDIALRFVK